MNNLVIIIMKKDKSIAGVIVLIIIFFTFAPDNRIYNVNKHFYRLIKNPAQLCFDLNSKYLVNKNSAYITGSTAYNATVNVTFRAKNGLNMYLSSDFECPLIEGVFDEHTAFIQIVDKQIEKNKLKK